MDTVGLGNALTDVLLRPESDRVLAEIRIRKGAMEMIGEEQMGDIRKSLERLEKKLSPGGSACNTIRAMARLGAKTGFIGKIGSDDAGLYYENEVIKAGVVPHFIKTEGISGSCTVLISPDGERTMATFLGPAATITPDEIREDMLKGYQYIYVEGYLIVNEPLVYATMQKAKQAGLKIALDLSNFNIVNAFKDLLSDIIPRYVDILFSNESEAEAFTGQKAEEAVRTLSTMADIAVVTLGKNGALIAQNGTVVKVDAEGGKPVDTTGAGDHFAAGFLFGQTQKAGLEQCGRIGSLLAGYVIDTVGPEILRVHWEEIKLRVNDLLYNK
ncbi:MAG: adenosine kinase [Tannerellaceae bacterium]|nr:adenosine kinase [Tannerellaceae bacterium]